MHTFVFGKKHAMIQRESLTYRPNESWNHAFYLLNCSLSPPPPTHYKDLLLINMTHKRVGSGGHRRAFVTLMVKRWYLKASTVGAHMGDSIFVHVMIQNHEGKIKIKDLCQFSRSCHARVANANQSATTSVQVQRSEFQFIKK